jgi:pilus assembly protein CpaC
MEPEVSTLDFANGIRLEGFLVPALKTRRARTGVELRDGQSFALAGLLDNSETQTLSKIPGIGDIPILGNLFKSKSFQKNETELMFIVTANMVKPVNRDDLPNMPNVENLKSGSPLGIGEKADEVDGKSGFTVGSSAPSGADAKAPAEVKPGTPTPAPAAAAPAGATKNAIAPGGISATKDGAPAAVPSEQTAKASPNQ